MPDRPTGLSASRGDETNSSESEPWGATLLSRGSRLVGLHRSTQDARGLVYVRRLRKPPARPLFSLRTPPAHAAYA
jgi:hypothetical protein